MGNSDLLNSDYLIIAIVGTRKATPSGLATARSVAKQLGEAGVIIVSGLAFGIDKAAHLGCLDAGGKTIAVLANGLDQIYPRQHQSLAENILKTGGAIISEYEKEKPYLPSQFLERNRIISGLSNGVIVIEAPFGSGALNTAAHAIEQNKEVFIVPGDINNPNYAGSHHLIKQGAALITSAKDVFAAFNIEINEKQKQLPLGDEQQKLIYKILQTNNKPLSVDEISQLTKINIQVINQALSSLVIEGVLSEDGGRYFIL